MNFSASDERTPYSLGVAKSKRIEAHGQFAPHGDRPAERDPG
ncbi:MAG: hypothetical protein U5J99_14285 [Parvularculaceae bacterium]|nr:hypothetical protein [Parvularculaceae bacterium]